MLSCIATASGRSNFNSSIFFRVTTRILSEYSLLIKTVFDILGMSMRPLLTLLLCQGFRD